MSATACYSVTGIVLSILTLVGELTFVKKIVTESCVMNTLGWAKISVVGLSHVLVRLA